MPSDESFRQRLSGADELMWRIEADPVLRSPILVVGLLDAEPRDQRVRATLASWQEESPTAAAAASQWAAAFWAAPIGSRATTTTRSTSTSGGSGFRIPPTATTSGSRA